MAFEIRKFLKGILIREENTLTPKEIQITPGGAAGTKTTITSNQTTNVTISLPNGNDELVGWDTAAELTNKTLEVSLNTITTAASGNLTSTELNAALSELQGDIDTRSLSSDLSTHTSDTTTHGTTGDIVGTSDSQTLTNKTISGSGNTLSNIASTSTTFATETSLNIGTSNTATAVNIGTGTSTNTINIGGASSTVNITGAVNNQNVTNLNVTDKLITLNDGGGAGSGAVSGIEIEENASATGYIKTSADRNSWEIKAPNSNGVTSLTPGATTDTITLNAATQTLTNKTLTTPSTDIVTLDGQASTPTNPSAGFYKAYVKDSTQKLTILDSSGVETTVGSGAGVNNYITANDGSVIGSWVTYDDGASATPVNGVDNAGSPTVVSVTFATSSSTLMRGSTNFLFTHSAANSQGEGFSYLMSIDPSDRGKVLMLSFDYKVDSGTFADNDMTIWFYDATNGALIQPAPYQLKNSSLIERFRSEVQIPSSCASLRVIFHVATSTATAYTLRFDDFVFGRQEKSYGSPITDWVSYTPTLSNGSGGITNATTSGKWRRVGDEIEITGDITFSAASAAFSVLYVSIPSGLSVDTNKINVTNFPNLGLVNFYDNGVVNYSGRARYKDTTTFHINYGYVNTSDAGVATDPASLAAISNTTPFTYGASDGISFTYKVPISGWSSGTQMSADAGNSGLVAFESRLSGTQTISATTETTVQFNSTLIDTAGAANTGAYSFVAPSSGYYDIAASVNTGGDIAEVHYLRIKVDGAARRTSTKTLTANDLIHSIFASNVYLTSGQVVTITSQSTSDASYTLGAFASTAFTVKKLQGNQVIAASDTVAARYMTNAGQSIANGATAIVDFEDISHDYQGSVTTGASWKFTAPVSGLYSVDAVVRYANNQAWTQAGYIYITIYKNGAVYSERGEMIDSTYTPASNGPQIEMYDTIRLLAGEYIDIRTSHAESTARTLLASQRYNRININRIGNY